MLQQSFLIIFFLIISCDTNSSDEIIGCTDNNACNYDPTATENDGSCQYLDCLGDCDGGLELDVCNVCDGSGECDCNNGTNSCICCCEQGEILDCFGVCNGGNVVDDCGICNGDGSTCISEQLDIITWNIQNFPKHDNTIETLSYIIDDLNVDIVALQEIENTESLAQVSDNLGDNWIYYRSENSGYKELSYLINTDDVIINNIYTILNGNEYAFAYRLPYVLDFDYSNQNYILINIHYKCCDGSEDRRSESSQLLDAYIDTYLSNKNVIVIGDFNDLLIDDPNVFEPFLSNPDEYKFADYAIAEGSPYNWSYPSWPSHIDHILITNELFSNYESVETLLIDDIYFDAYSDYESLVSDHRPLLIIIY